MPAVLECVYPAVQLTSAPVLFPSSDPPDQCGPNELLISTQVNVPIARTNCCVPSSELLNLMEDGCQSIMFNDVRSPCTTCMMCNFAIPVPTTIINASAPVP